MLIHVMSSNFHVLLLSEKSECSIMFIVTCHSLLCWQSLPKNALFHDLIKHLKISIIILFLSGSASVILWQSTRCLCLYQIKKNVLLNACYYSLDLPARKKKWKVQVRDLQPKLILNVMKKKIMYKINLAVFPEYVSHALDSNDHKNKSIHLLHKHKIIINIWKFRESFSHFIITNLFITCNRIVTFYHTS